MQDEQLLGYLLKALDPREMRDVEQAIAADPALRARLDQLEAMLEPLASDAEPFEPPPGLAARTLDAIDAASEAPVPTSVTPAFRPASEDSLSRPRTWWDVVFASAASLAIAVLLLPAVWKTREQARAVECQDQLRQLGILLSRYATTAADQRIPELGPSGREAFAGVYAVRLKGAGLLDQDSLIWCPAAEDENVEVLPLVPQPEDLADADAQQVKSLQQWAGGRYAYNLGVLEGDQFRAPRLASRNDFAWMADVLSDSGQVPHPGFVNVLYEDGSVRRRASHRIDSGTDSLYRNDAGRQEAGISGRDAVLGPSPAPPFTWVPQY